MTVLMQELVPLVAKKADVPLNVHVTASHDSEHQNIGPRRKSLPTEAMRRRPSLLGGP